MHTALFTKDFENATVTVVRTFSAPKSKVWEAWTTQELLEQWWAPLPWKAVTKSFDFRVGGHWHYYMAGPQGEKEWCYVGYEEIEPEVSFSAKDAFCDEDMNIRADMPNMHWKNLFEEINGETRVTVTTNLASGEDLKKLVEMGFEQGFTTGLNQLEELLSRA